MSLSRKSQIVLVLSAIIIVGIVVSTSLNLNLSTLSTANYNTLIDPSKISNCMTVGAKYDSWVGQGSPGTGYPYKEVISDTKYVTSFKTTGSSALSERINIQGNLYEAGFWEIWHPDKAYYNVYITTDGSNWRKIVGLSMVDSAIVQVTGGVGWQTCNYNPVGTGQQIWIASMELQLIGPYVGALKVEVVFHMTTSLGGSTEQAMATDYAYLISGSGKINVQGYSTTDVPMYEIGETVPIYVQADYSGLTAAGNGHWELWAYPLRGGTGVLIKSWSYDNFREVANWKLPSDAWVRGSTDSRWRIELHNTLFSTDAVMVNTIDVKANAPPTPTVTLSSTRVIQGTEYTIVITGNTNKNTNEALVKYIVRGVYADTNYQFMDKYVPVTGATDPFTVSTTFTPPNAGTMKLQVWAHDTAGRESVKPAELTIDVLTQGSNPNVPSVLPGDINLYVLLAVILLAGGGIAMYVYQKRKKPAKSKPSTYFFKKISWRKKK